MAKQRSAWSLATPMLLYSCFCLLVGDVLFGYDTASFGGILANPGFVNQFGTYNPNTDTYAFNSLRTSLLSALAFIGKFIGCLVAGPAIEKYGHRIVFYALSAVSVIGIVLEITSAGSTNGSGRYTQFIVGRIIVYISVGLVEVDVTTYQAEIVPASFRGLVVVSLQLFLNIGSLLATGINRGFSTYTSPVGWKTVTGIQFIFPALIVIFTFFIPDSPRWLLSKNREEEAVICLQRLRPKDDDANVQCVAEIQAIKEALEQHVEKAPWLDLVRGSNLRRTMIVMVYYFFQQTTGQAFVSTYQTTFLKQNGFEAQAFTYPVINYSLSVVAVIPGMYLVDKVGRRYTLLTTFFFQGLWIFVLAGVGSKTNKSQTELNAVVAAFILYWFSYNMGGASIPYLLGGELPAAAVREKTQSLGAAWNVLWAFASNFSIPYLIKALKFQIGWVFGSIALTAFVFTFFVLPETKGLPLEEIDAVFAKPYNPFRSQHTPLSDAKSNVASKTEYMTNNEEGKPSGAHREMARGIN
ncbi:putative sugar transporter [Xylaria arbuscula]|nr:putative sugar transporter [Xylaria arbuscula]